VETSEWEIPAPGVHQVNGSWRHSGFHPGGIAVLNFPVEEPAHCLQAGVRVGRYRHPTCVGYIIRPVMVNEAPRPDGCSTPVGQSPPDRHRAKSTEWDISSGGHLERRRVGPPRWWRVPRFQNPTGSSGQDNCSRWGRTPAHRQNLPITLVTRVVVRSLTDTPK
jgi:hypothetical protein